MKLYTYSIFAISILTVACSGQKDADREYSAPAASKNTMTPMSSDSAIPEKLSIDPGDVDSGIYINARLAPESESVAVTADYIETQRSTLSMTTITARLPFPDALLVAFEVSPNRDFAERPVVLRVRAYRDNDTQIGEEQAYVLGKDARLPQMDENGVSIPRAFVVNALEGLTEIPDTMLLHAKADAWLTATGTDETTLDPLTATSPDHVSLMSNPVRINFEKEEAAL